MQEAPAIPKNRILNQALFSPVELAPAIEAGLGWRFPALVIMVAVVILDFLALSLFLKSLGQTVPAGMSPEMLAKVERTAQVMAPIKILLKPFGFLLGWIAGASLLFLMGVIINRRLRFRTLYTLMVYASLALLIEALLKRTIFWFRFAFTGKIQFDPSLGLDALISTDQMMVAILLSHLDVFEFWFLALLIVGIASVGRFSKWTSAAIVFPMWVLSLLVHMIYALVSSRLMSQLGT